MSVIGRILVVVQVVLSLFFAAFAGAVFTYHENWKANYEAAAESLELTKTESGNLRQEYEDYKNDNNNALKSAVDRAELAETTADRLQEQNALSTNQLETTKTELDASRALNVISADEARIRREETLKQRQVNESLHNKLDDVLASYRALKDDLFAEEIKRSELLNKHEQVIAELREIQTIVRNSGIDLDTVAVNNKDNPPPLVTGKVENADKGKRNGIEYIEISIGSDDGLLKGHALFVYRLARQKGDRPKYLGKIKLVHVTPDRAVGTVVEKAKNGIIEVGDNVSTKL